MINKYYYLHNKNIIHLFLCLIFYNQFKKKKENDQNKTIQRTKSKLDSDKKEKSEEKNILKCYGEIN